jgi:hypothetical protein
MSVIGPPLPTCALRRAGSCLGYIGRAADVAATVAHDPFQTIDRSSRDPYSICWQGQPVRHLPSRPTTTIGGKTEVALVIARFQFESRALAGTAANQFDPPSRTHRSRHRQPRLHRREARRHRSAGAARLQDGRFAPLAGYRERLGSSAKISARKSMTTLTLLARKRPPGLTALIESLAGS